MRAKVGDTIRIIKMQDENGNDKQARAYAGRTGIVEYIDGIGALHGTWGGLSVLPEDEYEVLAENPAMPDLDDEFICNHEVGVAHVDGMDMYYTEDRLSASEVPEGFFKYDVRGKDSDWTDWATIEPRVIVNFAATVLSPKEIPMQEFKHKNPMTGAVVTDTYYEIKDYGLEPFDEWEEM